MIERQFPGQTFLADIRACPRCGSPHSALLIARYDAPTHADAASFWAVCPTDERSMLLSRDVLTEARAAADQTTG